MWWYRARAAILGISLLAAAAFGDDWPRWRGPGGDGINREAGLSDRWPAELRPLWTADVGVGFASPVARSGKVYLFSFIDGHDTLNCYDANTGNVIWSDRDETGWSGLYSGTRATPCIETDRIYTYGGVGDLTARDIATGKSLWRLNVVRETDALPIRYAQASNPLIVGDLIYVQGGWGKPMPRATTAAASKPATTGPATTTRPAPATRYPVPVAIAVDKHSGKIVWRSQFQGMSSYASIIQIDVDGTKQLVVFASEGLVGMDPASGKTIWHEPWPANSYGNCAEPIYRDGHLFITSFNKQGCMMLKVSADGVERLWESKETNCHFQPPILDGDSLYLNSEGTLKCLAWPTNEIRWVTSNEDKNLLNFGGSLLRITGERMILLSQNGRLTLATATPKRFDVITSVADFVEGRQVWATPTIHNGKLYVKGEKELVCVKIAP